MQRTIKLTKFTYAESVLNEEGGLETKLQDITIMETNEKKALKKAFKEVGVFKPLKVEQIERLYSKFLEENQPFRKTESFIKNQK